MFVLLFLLVGGVGVLLGLHFQKDEAPKEELLHCGTLNLVDALSPSDSALNSHPGFSLFSRDCKQCHALDAVVVGPGMMEAVQQKDPKFLRQLLIKDPGNQVRKNRAYQKRAKAFGGSWHEKFKFGSPFLSRKEQEELMGFLGLMQKRVLD